MVQTSVRSPAPAAPRLRLAAIGLIGLLLALAGCGTPGSAATGGSGDGTTVTDVQGRKVTLPKKTDRVILGKGRLMYTTALLNHDDPLHNVVGWANDLKQSDKDTYKVYKDKFPSIAKVPDLGALKKNNFNTEKAISLKPQVLLVEQEDYPTIKQTGLDKKLDAIGTKVVVVDFRLHPLKNTTKSVKLIGQVLGRQKQAQRFADYYDKRVKAVTDKVAKADKPTTFLWRAAGLLDCCNTFADENLGEIVTKAGGDNLGDMLPGSDGALSPEKIIKAQPRSIIATGGSWNPGDTEKGATVVPYVELGYGAKAATVKDQLGKLRKQPGFDRLKAFKHQRVHALWHQFYDSPYNFMAVAAMGKWIHPELFKDVNLDKEYADFHKQFLPVKYQGEFFVGLDG